MKSLTEYFWFEIPGRRGFINITPKIEELVSQSGVREGLCLVNAMHITASMFSNDDESGLHHGYEIWLEKLAPHEPASAYRHNRTGEDNADAHLKRQIMGREVVVAITKGKLDLGPARRAGAFAKEDGNKSSMANSTAAAENARWSRLSASRRRTTARAPTVASRDAGAPRALAFPTFLE